MVSFLRFGIFFNQTIIFSIYGESYLHFLGWLLSLGNLNNRLMDARLFSTREHNVQDSKVSII